MNLSRGMRSGSRGTRSGGVGWIPSLMKQLLEEVRIAPVGVSARTRIAGIHDRSVTRVERGFARALVNEVEGIPVPFCGQKRQDTGQSVEPDRPVNRIDRLLDNIEASQFGRERQRQRRADARKPSDAATGAHLAREVAARNTGHPQGDDPLRVDTPRVHPPREDTLRVDASTRRAPNVRAIMAKAGRAGPGTRSGTKRPTTGDGEQLSESMAAILSVELEDAVDRDLVADIVKGVLDESRTAVPDRAVESAMRDARERLERCLRARAATARAT
jgi:Protein of unknown function (DUF2587)